MSLLKAQFLGCREIRAQNLDQFANSTANPYDARTLTASIKRAAG